MKRLAQALLFISLAFVGCANKMDSDKALKEIGCQLSVPDGYQIAEERSINKPGATVLVWGPGGEAKLDGAYIHLGAQPAADLGVDPEEALNTFIERGEEISIGSHRGYLDKTERSGLEIVSMGTVANGRVYTLICQGSKDKQADFEKVRESFNILDVEPPELSGPAPPKRTPDASPTEPLEEEEAPVHSGELQTDKDTFGREQFQARNGMLEVEAEKEDGFVTSLMFSTWQDAGGGAEMASGRPVKLTDARASEEVQAILTETPQFRSVGVTVVEALLSGEHSQWPLEVKERENLVGVHKVLKQ